MKVCRLVVLSLTLAFPAAYGQTAENPSIVDKVVHDAVTVFNVGIDYFTSPLRMDQNDLHNLLRFGASTAVAVAFDEEAANGIGNISHSKALNALMDIGHGYGDTKYVLIIPMGLYVIGLGMHPNDDVRVTGRQIFQALLYSSAVTQSLKFLIGRSRPDAGNDPMKARLFDFGEPIDDSKFSMPSGHATVAFAVSSVLAQKINNTYASIALYGLASTTAISRLYHNRHWLSDVFVGAVIGTATGIFVTDHEDTPSRGENTSPLRIMPSLSGVQLEYRF